MTTKMTAQEFAQRMLDTYGWFVISSKQERPLPFVMDLPTAPEERLNGILDAGSVVLIAPASLDDLEKQFAVFGEPFKPNFYYGHLYRAVAE